MRPGSIKLADVFGIRVGVDPSWFVVLFLIIWLLSGAYSEVYPGESTTAFVLAAASALLFFTSVVLHELGHALVAVRNRIGIAGIDLWLFGGVAKMRRDTDSPGVEFRVAIAGPIVTLVITGACAGAGLAIAGPDRFEDALLLLSDSRPGPVVSILGYLTFVNAALLIFNLTPAFPMDGGRIVRAIVWWRTGDRAGATRAAARLGRGFAYLFIGLGVLLTLQGGFVEGIWLVLIGLFLSQAARGSVARSEADSRLHGLTVTDVMDPDPVAVPRSLELERVQDEFFLRYRFPWFPVVDEGGRFVGVVTGESVESAIELDRAGTAGDAMTGDTDDGTMTAAVDESLEALLDLHRGPLDRLGAVLAVDGEGVLRGVVTLDRLRRELRSA